MRRGKVLRENSPAPENYKHEDMETAYWYLIVIIAVIVIVIAWPEWGRK